MLAKVDMRNREQMLAKVGEGQRADAGIGRYDREAAPRCWQR